MEPRPLPRLRPPPQALAIREAMDGSLSVTGAREMVARNAADLTRLLQQATASRCVCWGGGGCTDQAARQQQRQRAGHHARCRAAG